MSCHVCSRDCDKISVCSRCGLFIYCGKDCQKQDWPRHKPECQPNPFKLTQISSKGMSVVATATLSPGTKVFQEEPILLINIPSSPTNARIVLQNDYDDQWANETPESFRHKVARALVSKAVDWIGMTDKSRHKQRIYRSMFDKNSPKTDYGIFLTNALPLRSYSLMGVFPIINRINHSCDPNCSVHWNNVTNKEELYIMKRLEVGEELTISYVDMITHAATKMERREYLEKHFGFPCDCALCSLTGQKLEIDDKIREKVKSLAMELKTSNWSTDLKKGVAILKAAIQCFTMSSYPACSIWPFYLSSSSLHHKMGNKEESLIMLTKAEDLILQCRDTQSEDYEKIRKLKTAISPRSVP